MVTSAGVLAIDHKTNKLVLITNSSGYKLIFPKGHIDPGESSCEAAQREAMEEAGIEGATSEIPFICIDSINYHVMKVESFRGTYLESHRRERILLSTREALEHSKVADYVKKVIKKAVDEKIIDLSLK